MYAPSENNMGLERVLLKFLIGLVCRCHVEIEIGDYCAEEVGADGGSRELRNCHHRLSDEWSAANLRRSASVMSEFSSLLVLSLISSLSLEEKICQYYA